MMSSSRGPNVVVAAVVACLPGSWLCEANQGGQLDRLKVTAEQLRKAPAAIPLSKTTDSLLTTFKHQLRDWIEGRLPSSAATEADYLEVQRAVVADLAKAGLAPSEELLNKDFGPDFGYVHEVSLSRPPGHPAALLVQTRISIPCGSDDSIYLYEWNKGNRTRRLALERTDATGRRPRTLHAVHLSPSDAGGGYLVVSLGYSPQCMSNWRGLSYTIHRIIDARQSPVLLLDGVHSVWLEQDPKYSVAQQEVLLEFLDRSIDGGVHSRPHVFHYALMGNRMLRVGPIALRPQDFVEEWVTRPWEEMERWSAVAQRNGLLAWHKQLHTGEVYGQYLFVQQCRNPSLWQIGIRFYGWDRGAEVAIGARHFLVHQRGEHDFQMQDISDRRQPGCPGQSQARTDRPTLFPAAKPEGGGP